jgi:hypothetical protein
MVAHEGTSQGYQKYQAVKLSPIFPKALVRQRDGEGVSWPALVPPYSKLLLKETPPTLIPFVTPEAGRPLDSVLLVEGHVEEKSAQSAGQMRAREKVEI